MWPVAALGAPKVVAILWSKDYVINRSTPPKTLAPAGSHPGGLAGSLTGSRWVAGRGAPWVAACGAPGESWAPGLIGGWAAIPESPRRPVETDRLRPLGPWLGAGSRLEVAEGPCRCQDGVAGPVWSVGQPAGPWRPAPVALLSGQLLGLELGGST